MIFNIKLIKNRFIKNYRIFLRELKKIVINLMKKKWICRFTNILLPLPILNKLKPLIKILINSSIKMHLKRYLNKTELVVIFFKQIYILNSYYLLFIQIIDNFYVLYSYYYKYIKLNISLYKEKKIYSS